MFQCDDGGHLFFFSVFVFTRAEHRGGFRPAPSLQEMSAIRKSVQCTFLKTEKLTSQFLREPRHRGLRPRPAGVPGEARQTREVRGPPTTRRNDI